MHENVVFAFLITLFAGLATGIGSLMAFFSSHTNTKALSAGLGVSAGAMIYVSFVEILPKAQKSLSKIYGESHGGMIAIASFFAGILLVAVIDKFVPSFENPHEVHKIEELEKPAAVQDAEKQGKLYRMGIFSAIAIAVHNFPEGLATFIAALENPTLGFNIAIAIAIHNIPEGVAISVPIYHATGSRRKAFMYSFISGLAEPLGALLGYLIIMQFYSETLFGVVFASVAGIMVFISLDELLPTAEEYGEHHLAIYGVVAGMAVMAISLVII